MKIYEILQNGKNKEKYIATGSNAPKWDGVVIEVTEPTASQVESFKAIMVVSVSSEDLNDRKGKALPLLGGVTSADWKLVESHS